MDLDGFLTLTAAVRAEPEPVKGSRHIGDAAPCTTAEAAAAFIEQIRRAERHATHHAWAWRLAPDGATCRSSDDGEPSGTAGRPILRQLEARDLLDVVVVVSRYFGGTKLGAGGLARAYAAAAAAVLDAADVTRVVPSLQVRIDCGYPDEAALRRLLDERGLRVVDAEHGAGVRLQVELPQRELPALSAAVREATHGRARFADD